MIRLRKEMAGDSPFLADAGNPALLFSDPGIVRSRKGDGLPEGEGKCILQGRIQDQPDPVRRRASGGDLRRHDGADALPDKEDVIITGQIRPGKDLRRFPHGNLKRFFHALPVTLDLRRKSAVIHHKDLIPPVRGDPPAVVQERFIRRISDARENNRQFPHLYPPEKCCSFLCLFSATVLPRFPSRKRFLAHRRTFRSAASDASGNSSFALFRIRSAERFGSSL